MTTVSGGIELRPIFGTGLARSGGGLYSGMLSVHPEVEVALCPHLELYRSLRNAVVRSLGDPHLARLVPESAPMQDYYFTSDRIRLLDAMLTADLDLPFEEAEWESFLQCSIARAELETADLTPHYPRLRGETYREIFDNGLQIVAEQRQAPAGTWVGWHEPWTIDFFPALARAYPDARFIVMLRDIRAVVSSVRGVGEKIPEQFVQSLSYARHWRKYVALAHRYLGDPLFEGRILVTSHDDVVTDPDGTVRRMCDFLEVEYDDRMLDTGSYRDQNTGGQWTGNSSFEERTEGIKVERARRWRKKLDTPTIEALEWLCGAELEAGGWELGCGPRVANPGPEALRVLFDEALGYTNWRSDLRDPQLDIGFELLRASLLEMDGSVVDGGLIRRCFLFEETYESLRGRRRFLRT